MSSPTVRELMRQAARTFAPRLAVVAGEQRLTYGEAWTRGLRLAGALRELGLDAGDRVGVLQGNTIEAADLLAATTAAGIVRVPLYGGASPPVHAQMLAGTGCTAVVVDGRWAQHAEALSEAVGGAERVLVHDGSYEEWLAGFPALDPDPVLDEQAHYVIRHTGGTTGVPKAVAYSHRTWLASCRDWFFGFPPVAVGDASLNVSPIAHGSGYFFTPIWLSGGVNVLVDGFDSTRVLELLEEELIAYIFLVPTMLDALAHAASGRLELPSLKVVAVAGAPLPAATIRRAEAAFGRVLYQVYGQTEAVPVTLIGPDELLREDGSLLRSAGRAFPFSAVEIRAEDGMPVERGVVGEITIRASGQMEGYLDNESATRATLVDGWIRSGDAGLLDDEGFLFVLDRLADLIVTDTGDLWPSQVEDAALAVEGIREAAAVSGRSADGTQGVVVVVVADADVGEEVAAAVERAVGSRPLDVLRRSEPLPKSPVGKLQRGAIRALLERELHRPSN